MQAWEIIPLCPIPIRCTGVLLQNYCQSCDEGTSAGPKVNQEVTEPILGYLVLIGTFQVLQHRMVDMIMEYEAVKSLAYLATLKLDGDVNERKRAVSAAKVQVGKSGRMIGQNAVQMHGGMGVSDELDVGQYFKRLTAIDALFGNVDYHRRRFAGL